MDSFNGQQNNNERIQSYIEQQKEYERQLAQGQFQQNNGPFQYNNGQSQQNKEQFQQNQGQFQQNQGQLQQSQGYDTFNVNYTSNTPETPQEKAAADKICWITLALYILPKVAYAIMALILGGWNAMLENIGGYRTGDDILQAIMGMSYFGIGAVMWASRIASLVMLIYVRVKYPKNLFGKILLWIAIVLFAMVVIAMGMVLITCMSCAHNFPG